MTESNPDTLKWLRTVLRVLIKLNLFFGVLILGLLVMSIVNEGLVVEALGVKPPNNRLALLTGMRTSMITGILHVILTRLLAIVDTVSAGDPFVSENAARLETMAWAVLAMEFLHYAVGALKAELKAQGEPLDVDWNFAFTRVLLVLLLYVLARVFQEGARMREDLQGMV